MEYLPLLRIFNSCAISYTSDAQIEAEAQAKGLLYIKIVKRMTHFFGGFVSFFIDFQICLLKLY